MEEAHIFAIFINYYLNNNYMAEKGKPTKKPEKKPESSSKGGMSFGLQVILFVLAIFIIWVLGGGAQKEVKSGPLIDPSILVPATPTSR